MALEGTLREFCVADILQLLMQQGKTGTLMIEQKRDAAEVYFDNGAVAGVRSSVQPQRLALMLQCSGAMQPEQIARMLERHRKTFEPCDRMLAARPDLAPQVLEQLFQVDLIETFFQMMQWREGSYRFDPGPIPEDCLPREIPALETILLDVLRMIDEWPGLLQQVGGPDSVPERVQAAAVAPEPAAVWEQIDGRRSIRQIAAAANLSCYAVCCAVAELYRQGLAQSTRRRPAAICFEHTRPLRATLAAACVAGMLAVFVALGVATGLPHSLLPLAADRARSASPLGQYRRSLALSRVELADRVYTLLNARPPADPAALVQANLVRAADVRWFRRAPE